MKYPHMFKAGWGMSTCEVCGQSFLVHYQAGQEEAFNRRVEAQAAAGDPAALALVAAFQPPANSRVA